MIKLGIDKRLVGAFLFGALCMVLLRNPFSVFAQGPNGFTQIGSTTTATNFVDGTVVSGAVYQYAVTATDAAGRESASSAIVTTGIVPGGAGPHHGTVNWVSGGGTTAGFRVYRFLVPPAPVPTGLTVVVD